jgi:hypothetical protein
MLEKDDLQTCVYSRYVLSVNRYKINEHNHTYSLPLCYGVTFS